MRVRLVIDESKDLTLVEARAVFFGVAGNICGNLVSNNRLSHDERRREIERRVGAYAEEMKKNYPEFIEQIDTWCRLY